jgi:hypothetical protein
MLKTKRNTLAISLDCSHSRSEDVIEIISQFLSLSNLEDAMDHKSIEGSGTCTPESPVIITPKIHLDQDNQGLSLKHTAATSYFDLDSEDHLPKRRIQHNNSIIDCVN